MRLTDNQQSILDHAKKNGWFATDKKGKDFKDCEFLHENLFLSRTDAASWMGDDYIYRAK